jgi:hypothetical protein
MIIFATAYDIPTNATHAYALTLAGANSNYLSILGNSATRTPLIQALSNSTLPLFIMSHGEADKVKGHDGAMALNLNDTAYITGRNTFAFACYTSADLGKVVINSSGIWFGYSGPINAPESSQICFSHFLSIFTFIISEFPKCQNSTDIDKFLIDLKNICDNAQYQLDVLASQTRNIPYAATQSVRDTWRNLIVWLQGHHQPIKHPNAPSPLF